MAMATKTSATITISAATMISMVIDPSTTECGGQSADGGRECQRLRLAQRRRPPKVGRAVAREDQGAPLHRRIDGGKSTGDLGEGLAEVRLESIPFRPAEVRGAEHIRHAQQRMVRAH